MTSDAPHTNPNAKPCQPFRAVVESRVIKCDSVYYRDASFGGAFLLSGKTNVFHRNGKSYALVDISWYGWKPKSGACRITLLSEHTIDEHYTGEVIADVR